MSRLTTRQCLFVAEYVVDFNAARAAVRAGYSKRSCRTIGSRLLKNEVVQQQLTAFLRFKSMSAAEALARLTSIARGSLAHFIRMDEDGQVCFNLASEEARNHVHLIKKLKVRRRREKGRKGEADWEIEWLEIGLHDGMHALDKLLRAHGAYRDTLSVSLPRRIEIVDFSPGKDEAD